PTAMLIPDSLATPSVPAGPPKAAGPVAPVAPSVEFVGLGSPARNSGAAPSKAAGEMTTLPVMEPVRIPGWLLEGASEASRPGAAPTETPPAGKAPTPRKPTSPPAASGDPPK